MKTLALLLGSLVLAPGVSVAQDTAPATTNPAERIVYRGDLTMEQQYADQLVCFNWSSEQTDWDPAQAYAALEGEHGDVLRQYHLAGLAVGAIAGNAGEGAAMGSMGSMADGGADNPARRDDPTTPVAQSDWDRLPTVGKKKT